METLLSAENLFLASIAISFVGWLLLFVAPYKRVTKRFVHRPVIPLLLSLMYVVLIAIYFFKSTGSFFSLKGLRLLFSNDYILLAGWIHYLAFDLILGAWQVREAKKAEVPHILMIPVLLCSYMLGPIGFVLFFIIRAFYARKAMGYDVKVAEFESEEMMGK